ncbi:mannose-1-phosphate guanylyltransferase/mannose-6-phosphate isomerase [Aurantimonas sp. 22II-16-19i]|uniref:mannose-1-phosphate guanylyltransferase/mannose-6-phosphate isomerase n=1 Tax=Aurantimonas sp. 22II-16-19i TaxID=1317114 RepID=UPI0009F8034D|nr:mannose-1-phosphate guanylyltransferase/mannose-6-phosphate isomerase [Aurantimonas sp. 22II-16-19i]ORE86731.1 mannose-1-phosphate guanylyltransferase/mannose-6-phosphate isomerase [Aurantimonas sp. 22II-16-19i]
MRALIRPLILSGGSGKRLWPVSRDTMPKQFLTLHGERSLFQDTVLRVSDPNRYGRPVIVTALSYRFEVERQLRAIGLAATVLLEPEARESGPAILAGCLHIASEGDGEIALILASDHAIGRPEAFHCSVDEAVPAAAAGLIVTFGIKPDSPASGYGYIEPGQVLTGPVTRVSRFVEKPDRVTAVGYIASGFLWNSGNFLVQAEALIEEYARLDRNSFEAAKRAVDAMKPIDGALLLGVDYGATARSSIDYTILERTDLAAVVPAEWAWSDVGTWDSVWQIGRRDDAGNVVEGEVETLDSTNCLVRSCGTLTSIVGVRDLVVIVEPDAVMVADRRSAGSVKTLVDNLARRGVREAVAHARDYRPWGWFEIRDLGETFKVKRLGVYPGGRLSLQKHRHRAEHWVVVTGTARVTVDDTVSILTPNQHAEIPLGAVHRLENPGDSLLEIIEVQYGSYLGEDDIIRIDDVYDRAILTAAE